MLGTVSRLIRRFRRDERGAVLILFVLVVLPLLTIAAVVIDFSQTLVVKRQLTAAVDSAALALGALPQITEEAELSSKAHAYIQAHYPANAIGTLTGWTATRSDNGEEVVVTATVTVPTAFMGLAGLDEMTVNVASTVLRKETRLEVVMVLDNSGSMGGTKISSLKTAANELVTILFGENETSESVKIGLVPFTGGVNVKSHYDVARWPDDPVPNQLLDLDKDRPAALNNQIFSNLDATESTWTVLGKMGNTGTEYARMASQWKGCLRSRAAPFDTEDAIPTDGNTDTLFSAYFRPFGGNSSDKNSYANVSSNQQNENCPTATVQALTNVKLTITDAIDDMVADGTTNIPEALAWGWRVISPGAPFTDGAGYEDQNVIKAVIVLSDGENLAEHMFSSYGPSGSVSNSTLNTKLQTVCSNIKGNMDNDPADEDIVVYTITFSVNSPTIQTLMRNCATDANKYFNSPSADDLRGAFASIAAGLNQLRIMH